MMLKKGTGSTKSVSDLPAKHDGGGNMGWQG
jgi:hypothetical protein